MSTSANIIFANNFFKSDEIYLDEYIDNDFDFVKHGCQVYIHSDGYPENILPLLKQFLKSNGAYKRRNDYSYLSAWFITYYCMFYKMPYLIEPVDWSFSNYMDYYVSSKDDILEVPDFMGIGINNGGYTDCSFTYVIFERDVSSFNVFMYGSDKKFIELVSVPTCKGGL